MVSKTFRKIFYIISLITLPAIVGLFLSTIISSLVHNSELKGSVFFESAHADVPAPPADGGCATGDGTCGDGGGGTCGAV